MSVDTAETVTAFRDSARSLLQGIASPSRIRRFRESVPGFDRAEWCKIVEAGWPAILVPEAEGGLGLDLRHLLAVVEEIGRRPLPEPFIGAGVQAVALLSALPASALRDSLKADMLSGICMAGVAWQENAGELTLRDIATQASKVGDQWLLNGRKSWVTPGEGADGWLVVTEGPAVFWVEASTPGVSLQPIMRVDGSPMATIVLSNTSVSNAHRLAAGPGVTEALDQANDIARLAQAAELLGVARHTCETTIEYLKTRMQFGKPIGANQALQHRMVDAWIQVELSSACLSEVLQRIEQGEPLAGLASRAKARCGETAIQMTRLAVQFHGAIGFTDEFDLGLYWKRALHLNHWLGSAEAHRKRCLQLQREDMPELLGAPAGKVPAPTTDWATLSEQVLRESVRSFLATHYPANLRHPARRLHWEEVKGWYLALSRQGWIAPAWPKEHGGMALPPDKLLAFIEEFEDFGAARMPDQGLINLGPVLIRYGSAEQQSHYLPKIISGEHVWCQGYSEPNAGSDLASLRTEAKIDGEDFIVTGQKIWTTLAQDATHIFLLVRTSQTGKKQEGISFLLADLLTPGITIRPIRNIAGEEEFCEVFLDGARVPRSNLVGGLNEGWAIAKALLGYERLFVGSPKTCQYALGLLHKLARSRELHDDPAFLSDLARLQLDLADLRAVYTKFADIVKRGDALPPSVSLLKIWATETYTRIASKLVEIAGEDGATRAEIEADGTKIDPLAPLLNATITTIYGGTNEIQRNILSRQVLGLPV